jgi:outer membrane protein assembly factor BamD
MNRWLVRLLLIWGALLLSPQRCPAPIIFTPGEGWRYESAGGGASWTRARAEDQYKVAQAAFDKGDYALAQKAAKRTITRWEFSEPWAQNAQYLLARCYEQRGLSEKAFTAYQKLIIEHPKITNYNEVVQRQFGIANRFLAGEWFKLWQLIPYGASMEKTRKLYEQIIKNGPYSDVAPPAQLNIASSYEKEKVFFFTAPKYADAAKAYARAADRYAESTSGTEGLYKAGISYTKQAKRAEYDQSIAAQAIDTFTDFKTLHPNDPRVPETETIIVSLRTEQARGSFDIARYYEKKHRWKAASIYYNDVYQKDPQSKFAELALRRIDAIKKRLGEAQ